MNYIYETPWWLPAGIALLGVILFVTGNNRLEKRLKMAGLAVILLGIGLAVLSFVLDSEREKVIKRTRALVQSVESRNWTAMKTYLHPNVTVFLLAGRDRVADATQTAAEYGDVRQIRITAIEITKMPDEMIRASVRVYATMKEGQSFTDWDIEWEKTDNGWMARNIVPRGGPGVTSSMIEEYVGRRNK